VCPSLSASLEPEVPASITGSTRFVQAAIEITTMVTIQTVWWRIHPSTSKSDASVESAVLLGPIERVASVF
jgi:hypothetical protein